MLTSISIQGQGTFIYDQQSADESLPGETAATIQGNEPFGQSFTPTLSSVGFVRLEVFDGTRSNGLGTVLSIRLRANSITGTILGSTEPVSLPDNYNGFPNFIFGTPVAVSPGTVYYFDVDPCAFLVTLVRFSARYHAYPTSPWRAKTFERGGILAGDVS